MNISVIGAGAWGTALAIAFAARHPVCLWAREPEVVADIRSLGVNSRFLPSCTIPESIAVTSDLTQAVQGADLLILASPIVGLRATVQALCDLGVSSPLVWVCKGFEAGSGMLPHQVVTSVLAQAGVALPIGALSGPSFALEVAQGQPTAITLAASDALFARETAQGLHGGALRIYASDDLVGVEVGGAVKNVLAIATGVCDGLGFGLNARAALITRGLAEIARLGQALGARRETFMGLAGMGDLILTCTGDLSRNRQVGLGLAQGKTLARILEDLGHVAEGVPTARETAALATRLGVDMPISQAVAAVLDGQLSAADAVQQLLARHPRDELA